MGLEWLMQRFTVKKMRAGEPEQRPSVTCNIHSFIYIFIYKYLNSKTLITERRF